MCHERKKYKIGCLNVKISEQYGLDHSVTKTDYAGLRA